MLSIQRLKLIRIFGPKKGDIIKDLLEQKKAKNKLIKT